MATGSWHGRVGPKKLRRRRRFLGRLPVLHCPSRGPSLPIARMSVFVPQGRTRIASDFNPWLAGRHGLKPEAMLAHPCGVKKQSLRYC